MESAVRTAWRSAISIADQAAALVQYCRILGAKAKPNGIVHDVSCDVATTHELSVHEYLATDPLQIDYLSVDEVAITE